LLVSANGETLPPDGTRDVTPSRRRVDSLNDAFARVYECDSNRSVPPCTVIPVLI